MAPRFRPKGLLTFVARLLGPLFRLPNRKPFLTPDLSDFDDYRSIQELQRNYLDYCYQLRTVDRSEPGRK